MRSASEQAESLQDEVERCARHQSCDVGAWRAEREHADQQVERREGRRRFPRLNSSTVRVPTMYATGAASGATRNASRSRFGLGELDMNRQHRRAHSARNHTTRVPRTRAIWCPFARTDIFSSMSDTKLVAAALDDRYIVEREIGSGGMAVVYLARDRKLDREVALKVLRPELGAVLGAERFLAEIKISARLDHPHILKLLDSGESNGLLYCVLPYVRGESLRHKLDREHRLSIDEALKITARSPARWSTHTARGSSTATSSRRTS
jgi:hypothetical protein